MIIKKNSKLLSVLILITIIVCNYFPPIHAQETDTLVSQYPSNEIIVKYKDSSSWLSTLSLDESASLTSINEDYALVTVDSKDELKETLNQLKKNKNVAYTQPNYTYSITSDGTKEPDYSKQWALYNDGTFETGYITAQTGIDIGAEKAWDQVQQPRETIVAVIDTGIDYTHPDLVDSMWINQAEIPKDGKDNDKNGLIDDIHGWNFYDDNNILFSKDSEDDNHGTHCAGTIAASVNDIGIAGIASKANVKIMALKALGGEDGTGTTASVIKAISYAESMGADICNLSCGMADERDVALGNAIKKSSMLFVSAAGNGNGLTMAYNNDKKPTYPASFEYDNIISVANIRCDGKLHILSNYGINSVDIAAPGTRIYSTQVGGEYKYMTGTSMAAPVVTGVAALLYSQYKQITPRQVREVILNSARPLDTLAGKVSTGGMVDAYAAMTTDVVTLLSLDVTPPTIKTSISPITNSNKKKLNLHITDKENAVIAAYAKGKKNSSYFKEGTKGTLIKLNTKGNASLMLSSSGTYTVYAIDKVGNEELVTVDVTIEKPFK